MFVFSTISGTAVAPTQSRPSQHLLFKKVRQPWPLLLRNFCTTTQPTKWWLQPFLARRFHLPPPFFTVSLQYPLYQPLCVSSSTGFIFTRLTSCLSSTPKNIGCHCLHLKAPSNRRWCGYRNWLETVPKLLRPNRRPLQDLYRVHRIASWIHSERTNTLPCPLFYQDYLERGKKARESTLVWNFPSYEFYYTTTSTLESFRAAFSFRACVLDWFQWLCGIFSRWLYWAELFSS